MRLVLYDGIDLISGVACFFIHSNTDVALSPGPAIIYLFLLKPINSREYYCFSGVPLFCDDMLFKMRFV